jgi:hypothetical protein
MRMRFLEALYTTTVGFGDAGEFGVLLGLMCRFRSSAFSRLCNIYVEL